MDRSRENRSQFVFTKARGRDVIFWQSARTSRQARPNVSLPTARAAGQRLEILVDSHERYSWTFTHRQATTRRRVLPAGDYGVEVDGNLVAAVERKSLTDLVSTIIGGKLRYLRADLSALPQAAVVVEDRYSAVFKLEHVRPAAIADGLGEAAARFPAVPIVFTETRPLAQEWTYPFLGAAVAHHHDHQLADSLAEQLPLAGPLAPAAPTTADVRAWARRHGLDVPRSRPAPTRDLGRIPSRTPRVREQRSMNPDARVLDRRDGGCCQTDFGGTPTMLVAAVVAVSAADR